MTVSKSVLFSFLFLVAAAWGCDSCAIYSALETQGIPERGLALSVAEQFTSFGTLQENGREVPNPTGQYLDSSITQAILSYSFNRRFALQVGVPFIHRTFERPEGFDIERGSVSGIGDVSLLGNFLLYRKDTEPVTFIWNVLGGVKFPTGDPDRIKEEFHETEIEGAPESGIHGHDLALSSGSWDGIIGTSVYVRCERAFFKGAAQYALRTKGRFDYRYANELSWDGTLGGYLVLAHEYTLAIGARLSGEHKNKDRFRGDLAQDTARTSLYLGPEIAATFRERASADFGVDVPVLMRNSALQAVPDYRIRGAVTWRF